MKVGNIYFVNAESRAVSIFGFLEAAFYARLFVLYFCTLYNCEII